MKYADFANFIIQNGIAMGKPVSGFFELTSRCNLNCKMCYICGEENHNSLMDKEISAKHWIEIGKQAKDAGVLYLTLTGGEIFMRKDFFEIYDALANMGFIITLYTNGTLFNDDMINHLAKNPPLRVSISVYGACPETYGKVTGQSDAFYKVMGNIRKLQDAKIGLQLKTTVIQHNSGEFRQLAEFARGIGLNMGLVNYISPRRDGIGTDPLSNRLEPKELAIYEKNADNSIKQINQLYPIKKDKDLIIDDVMSNENVDNFIKRVDLSLVKKTAFRCTAGKCAFWLSWEGKMFPCGLLSEIYSEPLNKGFEGAWNEIRELCKNIPSCQACESCSYYSKCLSCPARLKLETKSFEKIAPYLCEHIKERDLLFST